MYRMYIYSKYALAQSQGLIISSTDCEKDLSSSLTLTFTPRPQRCTRPVYLAQGDSGTLTETKRQAVSDMETVPWVKSDDTSGIPLCFNWVSCQGGNTVMSQSQSHFQKGSLLDQHAFTCLIHNLCILLCGLCLSLSTFSLAAAD